MFELIKVPEPSLLFGYGQSLEDPRDGLTIFGPFDRGIPIRSAVIGRKEGIQWFKKWVSAVQGPMENILPQRSSGHFIDSIDISRPPFPGFEPIFRVTWDPDSIHEIEVPGGDIETAAHIADGHERVYRTVGIFLDRIQRTIKEEEKNIEIWFIVIPDYVKQNCRVQSRIPLPKQVKVAKTAPAAFLKRLGRQPSLFEEHNVAAIPYQYEINFHNQLKARLLGKQVVTQIIQEKTIAYREPAYLTKAGRPKINYDPMRTQIAWNICASVYYKVCGRPWKLSGIREGVCYVGLVFKKVEHATDYNTACCAAQMFLDSGDGVVFKGAVGPWYNPVVGDYHLSEPAAKELMNIVVNAYTKNKGGPPKELFVHGKVSFNDTEWTGFKSAVPEGTNLVGVRIKNDNTFKLFKNAKTPALRGLAYVRNEHMAYLWTKGFVPKLQTYPGREVPNPILIDVCRGNIDIEVVLNDIMALTKLNYNACKYGDGIPVTLRFANSIGEILTAGPQEEVPPLLFKYYI